MLNALSVKDMTATLAQHQTGATSEIQFSDMQLLRIEACAISVLRIEVARALLKPLDLLSLPCCCPSRARAKYCNIRPDERTLENLTIFCSIAQARIGQLSLVVCPTTQKCLSSRVAYCMHGPTFSSLCGLVVSKRPKAAELQSGKDHRGSSISVARG